MLVSAVFIAIAPELHELDGLVPVLQLVVSSSLFLCRPRNFGLSALVMASLAAHICA